MGRLEHGQDLLQGLADESGGWGRGRVTIRGFEGGPFVRGLDTTTGLPLWVE